MPCAANLFTTLASVAMEAWSVPGTQQAFLPSIRAAAYKDIADGIIKHVSHVEHTGDVRGRNDDGVGSTTIGFRTE